MSAPRLLLFGSPGAGKTSLEKVSGPFSGDLTVLDCDGKSALKMLEAEEPFSIRHPMKHTILDADAVALVVDASAPKKQMNEDFRQAARWLKHLHQTRGRRADVAELPVYVVLTKCDLLARKDDTAATWTNRLEEAKRQYFDNFNKFLKDQHPGFGTIKLKVVATTIKQPAFPDKPLAAQTPFGIAEWFQDSLQSAVDFQERRQTAQSRLQNLLVGMMGAIALLILTVALLVVYQPSARNSVLEERVRVLLPKPEAGAAERLQGSAKKLEDRDKKLANIEQDPAFQNLPSATRGEVTRHRQELAEYIPLLQESQTLLVSKLPYHAADDAELQKLHKSVLAFSLPKERVSDWEGTLLGQRVREMRKEYEALQVALKDEEKWLRDQIAKNDELIDKGPFLLGKLRLLRKESDEKKREEVRQEAEKWNEQYDARYNARPRWQVEYEAQEKSKRRIPPIAGVTMLTAKDLGRFEPVKKAQADWATSKENLKKMYELLQVEP